VLPAVVAVAATPEFFVQIVVLLVSSAAIAYVAHRLGLVPIVGFLIAGIALGPHALGVIRDAALIEAAAEIGVVLLLFTIGIEFSLEKLARIPRLVFVGGGLQVVLAIAVTTLVLTSFGVPWRAGVFTGILVALSSTAIVLKLLANRGETGSQHGRVELAVLVFQDLAIVAIVLLIPALGGRGTSPLEVAVALGKAALIVALVLVFARRLMPRLLEAVARTCSPEIFLLTVVALCFGTAGLTSLAGVSLSLGAFLAGLLVSESRFSEYALGEILPLQVLFSAVFFVSVGMLLDVGFLVSHLPLVLAAVALVLVIKVVTTTASVVAVGEPLPVAAAAGLMLAQVGEFSFVLEREGREVGLSAAGLGPSGSAAFIAATVVLMVLTPALARVGAFAARGIESRRRGSPDAAAPAGEPEVVPAHLEHLSDHVIVAGYGEAARRLTRALHRSRVPYLITTLSPGGAVEAEADGMPVLRGDATRSRTLQLAGIERARMLVIPDDDPATAHRIAKLGRALAPKVAILVQTRRIFDLESLRADGAEVVAEELEGIVALLHRVLRAFDVPLERIEAFEQKVREGGYAALLLDEQAPSPLGDPAPVSATPALEEATRGAAGAGPALADGPARRDGVDLETTIRVTPKVGPDACSHLDAIRPVRPTARGCEECLRLGDSWMHLRVCMTCGHVGCCDSSPNRHARAHWEGAGHPIARSLERGETWAWCFADEREVG
jgi:monovalent cation:H+ antiporter-2, CPA2 family